MFKINDTEGNGPKAKGNVYNDREMFVCSYFVYLIFYCAGPRMITLA